MSTPPKKRLPGQSNADYVGRPDRNADFLGTESLSGGGDFGASFTVVRIVRALMARRDARRGR
ncbi:MAG TPA: hypothetical protein VJ820_18745 [Propionibacteriaceae bacterium]|nr:hypothetical protein [Propionibacteriaceae bacterium]